MLRIEFEIIRRIVYSIETYNEMSKPSKNDQANIGATIQVLTLKSHFKQPLRGATNHYKAPLKDDQYR